MTILPPNKQASGSKWIYEIKYIPDETIKLLTGPCK